MAAVGPPVTRVNFGQNRRPRPESNNLRDRYEGDAIDIFKEHSTVMEEIHKRSNDLEFLRDANVNQKMLSCDGQKMHNFVSSIL